MVCRSPFSTIKVFDFKWVLEKFLFGIVGYFLALGRVREDDEIVFLRGKYIDSTFLCVERKERVERGWGWLCGRR